MITIIVLLILAAVSISTLTGENGILTKANAAKEETERSKIEEQVKVAILGSYDQNGNLEINTLKSELQKIEEAEVSDSNGDFPVTVTVKGKYTFIIDGKGNISSKDGEQGGNQGEESEKPETPPTTDPVKGVKASDIASSTNKGEYYNKYIQNYTTSPWIADWRIFYATSDHIFLIANNYIQRDKVPKSKSGYSLDSQVNRGVGFFDYVVNDFVGSSGIRDDVMETFNNKFYKLGISSDSYSWKACNYFLDVDLWSVYANDFAEYVVGAPSLEMLLNSYNQLRGTDYMCRCTESGDYEFSVDGGFTWSYRAPDTKFTGSIYKISDSTEGSGYWISTPMKHGNSSTSLLHMNNLGELYEAIKGNKFGIRPVVCLKSDVELVPGENGMFEMKR